jgi:hypothetical protein
MVILLCKALRVTKTFSPIFIKASLPFLLILAGSFVMKVAAQKILAGSISGRVIDSFNEVIARASVSVLYLNDSSLASFKITNNNGEFVIKNLEMGTYILQITHQGKQPVNRDFELTSNQPFLHNENERARIVQAFFLDDSMTSRNNLNEILTDKYVLRVYNWFAQKEPNAFEGSFQFLYYQINKLFKFICSFLQKLLFLTTHQR